MLKWMRKGLFYTIVLGLFLVSHAGQSLGSSNIQSKERQSMESKQPAEKITLFNVEKGTEESVSKVYKTQEEWREILTPEVFHITRKKGTERAFSGEYNNNKEEGVYQCAVCGTDLFRSDEKFDSGTGWPSFWDPVSPKNILMEEDNSFFMKRTEIICPRCDSHLGHVFNDGPAPTGKRYCINSAALNFIPS